MGCSSSDKRGVYEGLDGEIKLIVLDPGHFHASLLQKDMIPQINKNVYVYAPEGPELKSYLETIDTYNMRTDNPTSWSMIVYSQSDYLQKMIEDKSGNVVILAGNNKKKEEYINTCIASGLNIMCDKPMAINSRKFKALEEAYQKTKEDGILLYDMMTERFEENNSIQRELINSKELFGELQKGTPDNPAIISESVHHFLKEVSGKPLVRPAWYYDVEQQGDGITDVTTHLIDLINYNCFPLQTINYKTDVNVIDAGRWTTKLSLNDFGSSTILTEFPDFLKKDINNDTLDVYANGFIQYNINGINVKVNVAWNLKAPEGTGDTHQFIVKGTKSNILILQGKDQGYKPQLYIEMHSETDKKSFYTHLDKLITDLQDKYPGLSYNEELGMIHISIPDNLKKGHEAHFTRVVETFLSYLKDGKLPEWEVSNTLAKYYITTKALQIAKDK